MQVSQGFALFIFSFHVFCFLFFFILFLKFFLLIYFILALCENRRTLTSWHSARKQIHFFGTLRLFWHFARTLTQLSQFLNLQEHVYFFLFFVCFFFYLFFILFIPDFFDTLRLFRHFSRIPS